MSVVIKTIKDYFNNYIYPKTKTKAVYDDSNNRLDTVLSTAVHFDNDSSSGTISDPVLKQSDIATTLGTSDTVPASQKLVNTVNTNLGSPSSASAVSGTDAFSKISTLNSDLASMPIKAFSLKSGSPLRFYISSYGVALIFGFVNGVGSKCILIQKSGSSVSCIDMSDNSVWSSAHFDIHVYSSDNNYIEITSDRSGASSGTYLTGF